MTVQLIRRTAKELAGAFYEQNYRSKDFRRAFPTVKHYLQGKRIWPNGQIKKVDPGWVHFVQGAKGMLAVSLRDPTMSDHEKERIADQLIEEAHRGSRVNARRTLQTSLEKREKEDMPKHIG